MGQESRRSPLLCHVCARVRVCVRIYVAEYMYFYLPYVAFAQCGTGACVGASTLFSVINEIPSRINFGANEAVFMHSSTNMRKVFAFVHANGDPAGTAILRWNANTISQMYLRAKKNFCCYYRLPLGKTIYLKIIFTKVRRNNSINVGNQCERKIFSLSPGFTIRASEDETSYDDSLSCENLW